MRRLQQRAPGRRSIRGKAAFLKKTALAAAFLAVPAGILSGCGTKEAETFSVTNFVMDTVLQETVYGSEDVTEGIRAL